MSRLNVSKLLSTTPNRTLHSSDVLLITSVAFLRLANSIFLDSKLVISFLTVIKSAPINDTTLVRSAKSLMTAFSLAKV